MPKLLAVQESTEIGNTEHARIGALTALREGGLQWPVVHTKHNKQHDEQSEAPGQLACRDDQCVCMHSDAQKGQLQDHRRYLQNNASTKSTSTGKLHRHAARPGQSARKSQKLHGDGVRRTAGHVKRPQKPGQAHGHGLWGMPMKSQTAYWHHQRHVLSCETQAFANWGRSGLASGLAGCSVD